MDPFSKSLLLQPPPHISPPEFQKEVSNLAVRHADGPRASSNRAERESASPVVGNGLDLTTTTCLPIPRNLSRPVLPLGALKRPP